MELIKTTISPLYVCSCCTALHTYAEQFMNKTIIYKFHVVATNLHRETCTDDTYLIFSIHIAM